MTVHEVPKGHQQLRSMFKPAFGKRSADIVDQHPPYLGLTSRPVKQVVSQGRGREFGQVFMFGNRSDFVQIKSAHGRAIFKGNHCRLRLF
jgi:hypothetical protein